MRLTAGTLALIVALTVGTTSAWGALFLTFSGAQAEPGAVVIVQTGGRGALPNVLASETLRVFLAPVSEADAITSPDDRRLVLLGRLRIDDDGNGFLRFVVPDVPVGDYTTFTHCARCASGSAGAELLATSPFPGSFVVLASQDDSWITPLALGAAAATVLVGIAAAWTLRRRRSQTSFGGHS